jgi:Sulfotransferase domain
MNELKGHQKVFGLGLSKTGTSSLGEALNILGIKTIHYPHDRRTLADLRSGNYELSILEEYQGIVDIPVAPYYAQLDRIYPDSKFILTVRDKHSWLSSIETHWRSRNARMNRNPQYKEFTRFISACVYGSLEYNMDRFLYVYDTHVRNVQYYFRNRPEDLLILDICGGDRWEKLCNFLGLSIPRARFPHANPWMSGLRLVPRHIAALIPHDETFIFVDGNRLGTEVTAGRRAIPFLERDGRDWGAPPDDETAISELERLRRSGASFMVFAWPAFWWLDHYAGLREHLRSHFRCVMENDLLVAFDLRPRAGTLEPSRCSGVSDG